MRAVQRPCKVSKGFFGRLHNTEGDRIMGKQFFSGASESLTCKPQFLQVWKLPLGKILILKKAEV